MPPNTTPLRYVGPPDGEPDAPTNLFRRHLPIADQQLDRLNRIADYKHLHARLMDALEKFNEHVVYHQIEAVVIGDQIKAGQANPDALSGYLADVGRWCHEVEQLINPDRSAVDSHAHWRR